MNPGVPPQPGGHSQDGLNSMRNVEDCVAVPTILAYVEKSNPLQAVHRPTHGAFGIRQAIPVGVRKCLLSKISAARVDVQRMSRAPKLGNGPSDAECMKRLHRGQ